MSSWFGRRAATRPGRILAERIHPEPEATRVVPTTKVRRLFQQRECSGVPFHTTSRGVCPLRRAPATPFGHPIATPLSNNPMGRVTFPVSLRIKGPVRGFKPPSGSAFHFRGVPFAATTAGANRYRPPQPPAAWGPEPLECFRFGPAAPQDPKKSMGGLLGREGNCKTTFGWRPLSEGARERGSECV